jgi:hypothetical protein
MSLDMNRIIRALFVGIVVWVVCFILGMVLTGTGAHPVDVIAGILSRFAWLFGILAAAYVYFFRA